MRTQLYLR